MYHFDIQISVEKMLNSISSFHVILNFRYMYQLSRVDPLTLLKCFCSVYKVTNRVMYSHLRTLGSLFINSNPTYDFLEFKCNYYMFVIALWHGSSNAVWICGTYYEVPCCILQYLLHDVSELFNFYLLFNLNTHVCTVL